MTNALLRREPTSSAKLRQGCSVPPLIFAIAAVAIAARIVIAVKTHLTHEDFLITLRYAENLAKGHGLVYNQGERVLGTTTPLYTLVLALVERLHLPAAAFGKALNIFSDGLLCIVAYRWLRAMGHEPAGRLCAFLIAVCPLHAQWSFSGMETSLVSLLGVYAWLAYAERRDVAAFTAAAVLFLLRWDTLLLTAVLCAAITIRDRRPPWLGLLLYLVIVAPWLWIATEYYGNPIPITAVAKSTVYGWRAGLSPDFLQRTFPSLPALFNLFFASLYMPVSLFAIVGVVRAIRLRLAPMAAPVAWFSIYWLAFLSSKVLLFPWYAPPSFPVIESLAAIGIVWLISPNLSKLSGAIRWAIVTAAGIVVAASSFLNVTWRAERSQAIEDRVRIPLALWIHDRSSPTDRILLEPIGYIGYYSRIKVIDIVGLVTPQVLQFYRSDHAAPVLDMVETYEPEWCVLRPGERARIDREAQRRGLDWQAIYQRVAVFSYSPTEHVYEVYRRVSVKPRDATRGTSPRRRP